MAWNQSNPADNVKIREMPGQIRDNWIAIEENDTGTKSSSLNQWVVHLVDRSTIGGANTPAPVDDTGLLYCRNDGATNELYFEDSAGTPNEIQFTDSGKIGSPTTSLVAQDITFGSASVAYTAPNLVNAYGRYDFGGGSAVAQNGCTMVGSGGTTVTVTFTAPRANANYVVVATAQGSTSYRVDSQSTTGFVIVALGSPTFFNFIVCGNL